MLPQDTFLGNLVLREIFFNYDGPKLFTCQNTSGQEFLVNWLGDDNGFDEWIYLPISAPRLQLVKTGEFTLRDAYLQSEDGFAYLIDFPDNNESRLHFVKSGQIQDEHLPMVGAKLDIAVDSLPKSLPKLQERAKQIQRPVLDIALGGHQNRSRIYIKALGSTLVTTQELIEAIANNSTNVNQRKYRIPTAVKKEVELDAAAVFDGSFGIRLEGVQPEEFSKESPISLSAKVISGLIANKNDIEALSNSLNILGGSVASKFILLLNTLVKFKIDYSFDWSSPSAPDVVKTKITWHQAKIVSNTLSKKKDIFSRSFDVNCLLQAIDVKNKTFSLLDLDENFSIHGKIAANLFESATQFAATVPAKYIAEIEENFEQTLYTNVQTSKYLLKSLREDLTITIKTQEI
jgi:hypothetical protein